MSDDADDLLERLEDAAEAIKAMANEPGWTIADEARNRIAALEAELAYWKEPGRFGYCDLDECRAVVMRWTEGDIEKAKASGADLAQYFQGVDPIEGDGNE